MSNKAKSTANQIRRRARGQGADLFGQAPGKRKRGAPQENRAKTADRAQVVEITPHNGL